MKYAILPLAGRAAPLEAVRRTLQRPPAMNPELNDTCADLVRTLHGFSAYSAGHLVLRILVIWGYGMVEAGHFDGPRDVGTLYIRAFNTKNIGEDAQSSQVRESRQIWDHLDATLPEGFSHQLAGYPFDDAFEAFKGAIYDWLRESSFDITMTGMGKTKAEIIHEMLWDWVSNIW